jgi:hypothetical protein
MSIIKLNTLPLIKLKLKSGYLLNSLVRPNNGFDIEISI